MSEFRDPQVAPGLMRYERRSTLVLVTVLHSFTHLYTCALLPLCVPIQRDMHLTSLARVTLLLSVQSAFYCVSSLPLGVLADRFSRKLLLGTGLLLNGLAFVGIAMAPNYPVLLGGLICAGIAGGFYHPAATALVFALFPNTKGKAVGLVGTGAALGFFLGPLFSGWRGQVAGWREACLEMGIAGVLAALLFMLLARDAPVIPHPRERSPDAPSGVRSILTSFIWVGVAFSMRDFGATGLATLSSLYLQKVHLFSIAQTGSILGVMSLPAIVANPLFGSLSEGRRRLAWLAGLLLISGLVAMTIPYWPRTSIVVGLLVFQFFLLASYPVMESAFADAVPDALRGRVYGVYLATVGVIGSAAPWMMGQLTDRLKQTATVSMAYVPAYVMLGLLIILGMLGVVMLQRLKRHPAVVALKIEAGDQLPLVDPKS